MALAGMVFVYPFGSHFRLSLAVVVLGILLLHFPELPPVRTATLSGVLIFVLRSIVNYLSLDDEGYWDLLAQNLPAVAYYATFGILFQLFGVRNYIKNSVAMVLLLSVSDVLSNCVEVSLRGEWVAHGGEVVFVNIFAAGIIRSILVVYGYYLLKRFRNIVLAEEQVDRYGEMTMMIAQLKAELFYLRKSSRDIEEVMEESYSLYKRMSGQGIPASGEEREKEQEAKCALSIARKIHEVKKDYYRVAAGIENILQPSTIEQGMGLGEIFSIIEQNTRRTLAGTGKSVRVVFEHQEDWVTQKHYSIVSLLNNLVINAIEACGETGNIRVNQMTEGQSVVFQVEDDGPGIKPEDQEIIFQVGYSTKFCSHTGKMSTGLGLSHVRDLTESLGGTVEVSSEPWVATRFIIKLPRNALA